MHSNLTDQINATLEEATFACCPVCNSGQMVRLVDDWQQMETMIPIVGCGNPWHYAVRSLGDAQQ